jgi:tetratricopeptide (TPR) repeat protein
MTGPSQDRIALAQTLCAQGRFDEAATILDQAIATAPNASAPHAMLGDVLLRMGRPRRAMAAFAAAVQHDTFLPSVCRPVDGATEEARSETILENCRHILARYPRYAAGHQARALALLTLGRETEARRAAEQALVLNPTVPAYYHVLIHSGDPHRNASAIASLQQLATVADELPPEDRVILHFLLAKAFIDQGRNADAFAQLEQGNALKRRLISYDERHQLARLTAIADAFPAARIAAAPAAGSASDKPVFVIGMPRSGTSLVEQILASHPAVFGAGELTFLPDLAGPDDPDRSADFIARIGATYVERITALAPAAERVVDKMPYNFLHAGLIRLALPHARIIHVRRHPLDTCFSCFSLNFSGDVGFAYDLGELGRYYRAYDALMAHWRSVLPPDFLIEVQYETLVADLEREARRMIAFCGLDWDPRCLAFHTTRRAVATASLHQVRQPVYKNAIGRADAFAPYLAPLRQALGDLQ